MGIKEYVGFETESVVYFRLLWMWTEKQLAEEISITSIR